MRDEVVEAEIAEVERADGRAAAVIGVAASPFLSEALLLANYVPRLIRI